jgi:tetratricopeptide (TPR) repeat protein/tRNA A-37 threonylcarbamoyl transferase component Bud32
MSTPPFAGNQSDDPQLDVGLRVAYGRKSRGPHSVLDAIERMSGEAPCVLLRDADSEPGGSPIIDPSSSERRSIPQGRGSYQILGEIARGGMGVVMKGHDTDLGRDVALKVLHKEFAKRPEVLQRFVEEAQIGGQLQHPGIVPVYELGLMADERPYFTMKLVKGRTLAALLAERQSSTVDRRRLLDVFESMCQTMAYAHSRGVIHRDLKPANVMVGAFGEVQVVDWGLAKVLPRGGKADEKLAKQTTISVIETVRSESGSHGSHSLVGSVMGTPAYMSPEQARGEVEKLDERSDVFSLGAILCEILTGAPPYLGESDKTLVEAANAKLDDATKRLDGCEADPELVALCRECLTPAHSARPASAEVVAQRIHGYLISVEERARQGQVDAAEARVKAQEERRARKLTVGLAGSVLVTLMLAGGGWAWFRSEHEARLRLTTDQVDAALSEAGLARGAKDWSAAQAAIARASASLEAGQASDDLRSRVSVAASAVDADASLEREARARETRNAAFLERLDRIRGLEGGMLALAPTNQSERSRGPAVTPSASSLEQRETAYLGAFREYGIDPESQRDTDVVESLQSSGIASSLASALDDWAVVRADIDKGFTERSKRLVRRAMEADSDPWRRDLRTAILADDTAPLLALAASAQESDLPPVTAIVLAKALARLQHGEESLAVLQRSVEHHPADFPLLLQLGRQLLDAKPRRVNEALRYLTAAHALRPESESVLDLLSMSFFDAKDFDQAISMARESLRLDPGNARAWGTLGANLHAKGDLDKSIEYFRKAIEIDPGFAVAYLSLGQSLDEKGDLDAGIASIRKAIEIEPGYPFAHGNLGVLLARKGDLDAAIASERKAIEIEPTGAAWHNNLGADLHAKGEMDAAMESFRKAIEIDPQFAQAHRNLGLALSDKGDLDAAIESYRKSIELDPRSTNAHCNLGLALFRKGDVDAAIESYHKAIEVNPKSALAYGNLGNALLKQGKFDAAVESCRKAIELDPRFANAHRRLGLALVQRGDLDAAIECFRKVLEIEPRSALAFDDLGRALSNSGALDEAIQSLRTAIEIDPRLADAHRSLGIALGKKGDVDGAIESYRKAIEVDPKYAAAYYSLARALEAQGEFDGAIAAYRKFAEFDSRGASSSNALAWLLATCADPARRDGTEAVRFAQRAVDLAPDASNFNTLGAALCCAREWSKAIEALDHSIQLNRAADEFGEYLNAVDHCFLATAHAQLDELEKARAEFTLAKTWHEAHPKHAAAADTARFLDEARAAIEAGAKR